MYKVCRCGALCSTGTRCGDCRKQDNKYYDDHYRNEQSKKVYKGKQWAKTRRMVLIRDNYLCKMCLARGELKMGNTVHHIKELVTHPHLAYDVDNLITLCRECHTRIHKQTPPPLKNPEGTP